MQQRGHTIKIQLREPRADLHCEGVKLKLFGSGYDVEKGPIADVPRVLFSSRSARSVALNPKPDAEFCTVHFLLLTRGLAHANAR